MASCNVVRLPTTPNAQSQAIEKHGGSQRSGRVKVVEFRRKGEWRVGDIGEIYNVEYPESNGVVFKIAKTGTDYYEVVFIKGMMRTARGDLVTKGSITTRVMRRIASI